MSNGNLNYHSRIEIFIYQIWINIFMGVGKYFFVLMLALITFISLIKLMFKLPVVKYQLGFLVVFMLFALIIAIGFYYDSHSAYWLGAILFAFILADMIYLYYHVSSYYLVWLAVSASLGFIICVSSIKTEEEEFEELQEKRAEIEKQLGNLEKETPKVEIIKEEKKPAKKKSKK